MPFPPILTALCSRSRRSLQEQDGGVYILLGDPFFSGEATDVSVLEFALHADGIPPNHSFCPTLFFLAPVRHGSQCWHRNHTHTASSVPVRTFLSSHGCCWVMVFSVRVQNPIYQEQQASRFTLAAHLSSLSSSARPPPQDHLVRPAQVYLVILWPLSLFGWWTDWLRLTILARADQISQHFVRCVFVKDRGTDETPFSRVVTVVTHKTSELVSNDFLKVEQSLICWNAELLLVEQWTQL